MRNLAGLTLVAALAATARADDGALVPPSAMLAGRLTLDDALRLFRSHGLDLIIADASVQVAEGESRAAGAVANPTLSAGVGTALQSPLFGSASLALSAQLSDNASILDLLVGKRVLRSRVAERALEAARLDRRDAQRMLEAQVKTQYVQAAVAKALLAVTREARDNSAQVLDIVQKRYDAGAVSEADLLRVKTDTLEADDAVNGAERDLREAKVALAYLLGVRQLVPDFDVDEGLLQRRIGVPAESLDRATVLREALANRPDLASARRRAESAVAAVDYTKRTRFPDIAIWGSYASQGTGENPIQPSTVMFGISAPLPLFYQNQGEVEQAEAEVRSGDAAAAKVEAQVVSDVEGARAALETARIRLDRMDKSLLVSARRARDLVAAMYEKGAASLLEMLDSQRTFLATNAAHVQASGDYWTAVFAIEQAIGRELH